VILDAYSRRVIGWALDRTMEDSLTLTARRATRTSATWRTASRSVENSVSNVAAMAARPQIVMKTGAGGGADHYMKA
jgi:transposase InsO family protein